MSGKMKAIMKGKMIVELQQADEKTVERMIENVKVCPRMETQLFSITQEISHGAQIFNQGTNLGLKYPDREEFIFDRKIKTKDGWIAGVDVKQTNKSMETINVKEFNKMTNHWEIVSTSLRNAQARRSRNRKENC